MELIEYQYFACGDELTLQDRNGREGYPFQMDKPFLSHFLIILVKFPNHLFLKSMHRLLYKLGFLNAI